MKNRTLDYIKKRKARYAMQHPTDLKSFLMAELDICENAVVKKHIIRTMAELDSGSFGGKIRFN